MSPVDAVASRTPSTTGNSGNCAGASGDASRLSELSSIPTLVLSADRDKIAGPVKGKRLAAAIEGARYVELENESHACTITSADRVNAIMLRFLKSAFG